MMPLKIFQQKVPVFEESQHAQVHADAGNQPRATWTPAFCPAHLPAQPKIHCRRRKEQRREGGIPGAVKDVASDYEKILARVPGTDAPIACDDDYKKDNEGKRIEKHTGARSAYSRVALIASTFYQTSRLYFYRRNVAHQPSRVRRGPKLRSALSPVRPIILWIVFV
jgi:hypothetical protein